MSRIETAFAETPDLAETELAIIDGTVADHAALAEAARAAGLEVVVIRSGDGGFASVAEALEGRSDLGALHILSHGSDGAVRFGGDVLSTDSMDAHADVLSVIGGSLSADGDLLLYGCDVGAGDAGRDFLGDLAIRTGADVAASDDATGADALGGDWGLEVTTGTVAATPWAAAGVDGFGGVLAFSGTIDFVNATYSGAFDDSDASIDATYTFNSGAYTLEFDGETQSALIDNYGDGYGNFGGNAKTETKGTIFFQGGEVFDITEIFVQNWGGDGEVFIFTSNEGDYHKTGSFSNGGGSEQTISLTGFTGISKLYIDAEDGVPGSVKIDNLVFANVQAPNTAPVFENTDPGTLAVDETSTDTTSVIHDVNANDGDGGGTDSVTYSITNGNTGSAFAIDADDGEIRLATPSALNYETTSTYTLEITADDGEASNNTATQTIAIDLNDIAPAITGAQSFSVSEDATNTTSVGTVATTGDDDSVTFSIQSGNTGNAFAINAGTGELTVNDTTAIDYETAASFTLGIRASDGGTNSDQTVTVTVTDVAPAIADQTVGSVDETASNGTVVGTVATTQDAPTGFSITGGNTGSAFAIDANGQITVADASAIDYETGTSFALTVQATDGNTSDTATVTVNVNDIAPAVANQTVGPVSEAATNGTVVGTVATTQDAPTGFSITGGNTGGAFAIDANGQITVADASAIDYETATSFALTVQTTDGTTPDTATVTVNVSDVEETPTFTASGPFTVNDSAGNGDAVGDVDANVGGAADAGVTYSITAGNDDVAGDGGGAFAIDANTGAITVADADDIDSSQQASFTLTVQAAEGAQTQTASVTVNVNDNVAPAVSGAVTPSVGTITDALVGSGTFTLTVDFDEAMNTGVAPTITFPTGGEDPTAVGNAVATLSNPSGSWTDGDTYVVTYDVADDDIVISDIDVQVSGAQDAAGNTMSAVTQTDIFSVITAPAPTIQSITSTSGDGAYGVGESVNVTVTFDEAVDFTANGGTLQTTLSNGETVTLANSNATNQTAFSGTYTIQEGETDSADLDVSSVSLTGGATLVANDDAVPASLNLPSGQNLADTQAIVVDANTPTVAVPDLTAASDTGSSDSDNLTSTATATVTGTTEAGATVDVRVGGSSVGTTTADGTTGAWSFTFGASDLSEGANTVDVIASDAVNTSADSADLTITLDTTAPTAVDDTGTATEDDSASTLGGLDLSTNDTGADGTAPVAAVNGSGANVGAPVAGTNGGLFTVNANGTVSFDANGDFEALAAGGSDTTSVTVSIQDTAGNTADSTLTVTVTGANDAPSGADKTLTVNTNATLTINEADFGFTDPDTGDALDHITVDTVPATGTLFLDTGTDNGTLDAGEELANTDTVSAADIANGDLMYAAPATAGDASFVFTVNDGTADAASGATLTLATQAPSSGGGGGTTTPSGGTTTTTTEGTTVTTTTTPNPDGTVTRTTTIDPFDGFQEGEDDDDFENALSDHVLAGTTGAPAVVASLPLGVGLTSSGKTTPQTPEDALNDLITRIEDETDTGSDTQTHMTGAGRAFLNGLPEGTQLHVNTITPTVDGDTPPDQPIVITGAEGGTGTQEALVIDVSGLPSGTVLQLDGVEFAAIVGGATVTGGVGDNIVVGDDGAQIIVLGEGDDILDGGAGDDHVGSEGGDDILIGGLGNDVITGGHGADAAEFAGAFTAAVIARGETVTVTDAGGTDTIGADVELLAFVEDRALTLVRPEGNAIIAGVGFDPQFYLAQHADVAAAVEAGDFADAADHFVQYGLAEGRAANAVFDGAWYLETYTDVAGAVAAGAFASAEQHYAQYGAGEGRDPGGWFDASAYLEANPDVAAAGLPALEHFVVWGAAQGRVGIVLDDGLLLA
jgi:hypothetical protein